MRKHIKFSTHTFARNVQRTRGEVETCTLLARSLSREDDGVLVYEVSDWMREQYPEINVTLAGGGPYFRLVGDKPALRIAMADRLLASPNRVVCIKRGAL